MTYIVDLNLENGAFHYRLLYLLAFLFSYLVVLYFLICDKLLNLKYVIATAAVFISFVIGTKILPWVDTTFEYSQFQHPGAQMAFSGLLAMSVTLILIVKYLGLSKNLYVYFSFAFLCGLALQKPACLFAGCCMGNYHNSLISVNYGQDAIYSALPVYELGGYLLGILILLLLKYFRLIKNIEVLFITIIIYSIIQIFAEFNRSEILTIAFANNVGGIKMIIWLYLLTFLLSIMLMVLCRFQADDELIQLDENEKSTGKLVLLLTLIIACFYFGSTLLYTIEIWVMNIGIGLLVIGSVYQFWLKITLPSLRKFSLVLLLAPIFLMSQTVLKDKPDKDYNYLSLGLGYKSGNASNRIVNNPNPDDCMGPLYINEFEHEFRLAGISFSSTQLKKDYKNRRYLMIWGVNAVAGSHYESYYNSTNTKLTISNRLLYGNPYIKFEKKWIGATFGAHIGTLSHLLIKQRYTKSGAPETGTRSTVFEPQFTFRVGPRNMMYMEYKYADMRFSPFPEAPQTFELGFGLGNISEFNVSWGTVINQENSMYIASYIPIIKSFVLEPYYGFGEYNTFMVSASYNFSFDRRNAKLNKEK